MSTKRSRPRDGLSYNFPFSEFEDTTKFRAISIPPTNADTSGRGGAGYAGPFGGRSRRFQLARAAESGKASQFFYQTRFFFICLILKEVSGTGTQRLLLDIGVILGDSDPGATFATFHIPLSCFHRKSLGVDLGRIYSRASFGISRLAD
jgi:hypothetical protein